MVSPSSVQTATADATLVSVSLSDARQEEPHNITVRLKIHSLQGEFSVLILRSWNFIEWFLSLKIDINWSEKHDKRTVGRSQISRHKVANLGFSGPARLWVKRRITAKNSLQFLDMTLNKLDSDQTWKIPRAILHRSSSSGSVKSQYWRLQNSALWKFANYFATYSIIVPRSEKCRAIDSGSNCANPPKNYRNKIKISIEGHLGYPPQWFV